MNFWQRIKEAALSNAHNVLAPVAVGVAGGLIDNITISPGGTWASQHPVVAGTVYSGATLVVREFLKSLLGIGGAAPPPKP